MRSELVPASYPADPGLLDELRAAWPPGPSPLGGPSARSAARGYVAADLSARPPGAAIRLGDRFGVGFVADDDGWLSVPVAGFGGRWWRAAAGDGLSAFVAGVPAASERALDVDQTNDSIVVGERVVVKWFRRIGPGPSRAAILLRHLAAVGFDGIPRPLGSVEWLPDSGPALSVAQGDAWLPGARDGWEWAVERVERGTTNAAATGRQLGRLVAGLHRALATPSEVIASPLEASAVDARDAWRATALGALADALATTDGPEGAELDRLAPAIRDALESIARSDDQPVALQPVHGDLHVGQVLEWSGGLAVIDFDGNPALGPDANAVRQPVERDVAQMLSSLDHAGRIVEHRRGAESHDEVAKWIHVARDAFLAAYGPVDLDLVSAFEAEQELRELVYAARFLPRWRYAPLATLRARYGP